MQYKLLEDKLNIKVKKLSENPKTGEALLRLNDTIIISRHAKITPKKIGQFTSIWQRDANGECAPYSIDDNFELMVINCEDDTNFGQFVFNKSILTKQKIIQSANIRGKNGMRVYPIWDKPQNATAIKTQNWQSAYFLDFDNLNLDKAKMLYKLT